MVKKLKPSGIWRATGLILVAAVTTAVPARADRSDIVPLAGPINIVQTPLTGVTAMLVDDANRRVYISSTEQNTVIELTFDGLLIASNNTLAAPEQMALINGIPFVTLRNTGQVVQLSPTTLTPTVMASGLTGVAGLTALNGKLYTTTQPPTSYDRALVEIEPSSGSTAVIPISGLSKMNSLYSFPGENVLFGTASGYSPSGIYRINPVTLTRFHLHETTGTYARLPDGDILAGVQGPVALSDSTLEANGRNWSVRAPFAANSLSVLGFQDNKLELYDTKDTHQRQRAYQFTNATLIWAVGSTRDGSQVVVAASNPQGTIDVYIAPGVRIGSPQSAPISSTRRPAPTAGAGNATRTAAPQTATQTAAQGPFTMKSIVDIEFGNDGRVYTSDSEGHVINVFNANAEPLAGWAGLGGVSAMTTVNGSMCATLRLEGSVVCLRANGPQRIARNIYFPNGLVASNGLLWTSYYGPSYSHWMSVDPVSGAQWRQPMSEGGFDGGYYPNQMPEGLFNGLLMASSSYSEVRMFNPATRLVGASIAAVGPIAVSPDGTFGIDQTGKRINAATMATNGMVYPGINPTISGTNPAGINYVAQTSFNEIVVYNENNPSQVIASTRPPGNTQIQRLEFRPNTNELWVGVYNSALGIAYPVKGTVNNNTIALYVDSQTDITVGSTETTRLQINFDPPTTKWETPPPLTAPQMEQPNIGPAATSPATVPRGPMTTPPLAPPIGSPTAIATDQGASPAAEPITTPTFVAANLSEAGPALAVEQAIQETNVSSPVLPIPEAPSLTQVPSQPIPKPSLPPDQPLKKTESLAKSVNATKTVTTKRRSKAKPVATRRPTRKRS
jgi:hypothetical protein